MSKLHHEKKEQMPENEKNPGAAPENSEKEAVNSGEIPAETELAALRKEVEALKAENSDLKDQYLRKLADYENFRKRMFREKEDAVQYANSSILVDLVDVLDDFGRAIKSSEVSSDFKSLHDGIQMIEKQFMTLLGNKYGLVRFESAGAPFDPNRHEAVSASEDPSVDDPVVIEEYMSGYVLHERVIRPAKVRVSMPPAKKSESPTEPPASAGNA